MIADHDARVEACDPNASFIVQAPAGSGKTELLTRRFLRLLARVEDPEHIVALTFTRKAASEMRERILHALTDAQQEREPESAHARETREMAKAALANGTARGWRLCEQPGRLRIFTIDGFSNLLSRAFPCQDDAPPPGDVTDAPERHYLTAARECVRFAETTPALQPACRTLLKHLDNNREQLLVFFVELLKNREPWLAAVMHARHQDKAVFENALAIICEHEKERLRNVIPSDLREPLCELVREVFNASDISRCPGRACLRNWFAFDDLPPERASVLANALLTGKGAFRKHLDQHVGFQKDCVPAKDYQRLKTESGRLLEALAAVPGAKEAFVRVQKMPPMVYSDTQWDTLQALITLLPVLAGCLMVEFATENVTDFSGIAQYAQNALGDALAPLQLALHLDRAIRHLMVDEFQDTSLSQFALLEKLVAGWEPDDGRTLFLVGDPMQSIYRFREAEVGLFLKARDQGIGDIRLKPLTLSCNFRSGVPVVEWVNAHFATLFPTQEDMQAGAISYSPSTPVREDIAASAPEAYACENKEVEAEAVIAKALKLLKEYPEDSIAILARSRGHLKDILHRLRTRNIPFQGVDIDGLANLPHVRDTYSLTLALMEPANRLPWVALLRTPWCGLTLEDVHAIAHHQHHLPVPQVLAQIDDIAHLSDSGRLRAKTFGRILTAQLAKRGRMRLVNLVADTLKALAIAPVHTATENADIAQFLELLRAHEQDGLLSDGTLFKNALKSLYSKQSVPARLTVMTIHKSKGLEFDSVLLPGLGAPKKPGDKPLLRWLCLPTPDETPLFLLSPIKASIEKECAIFNYLGMLDAEKEHYEQQRLLYVAATRAKKRLYLFAEESTNSSSFKNMLPGVVFAPFEAMEHNTADTRKPVLNRLPDTVFAACSEHIPATGLPPVVINAWTPHRLLGTIAHELLQWAGNHHPQTVDELPFHLAHNRLRASGLEREAIKTLESELYALLAAFFADPRGRWIIKAHQDAHTEWALLLPEGKRLATRMIDRSFIADGLRWIIDYKTGKRDDSDLLTHKNQLNGYARLCAPHTRVPIRCGIYYLADNHWVEWPHEGIADEH
ncbi:ATP-dependent DNA helicase [Legionella geestiana]|uniref:DNA 3'-5' helicase n=1 Tax=Legionella geestiana TaxID=45065 RepID=A0A0W0TWP2_9GAMM|nr:UvrD-helicase domain-containing protein [Legionella geestiana]KTD00132.1 ATP-dependent DNA helicase [Legionella geestiana]STX53483.1 ATP-dependent DNA helicase (UvrD/Rep helicase) [Legionella geestiana]